MFKKLIPYIESLRLKTLPLACSGILFSGFYAYDRGIFDVTILLLALLTAISLQIISNLANDIGDFKKGADDTDRLGPLRGIQKGELTVIQLQYMLIACIVIVLISGCALIVHANFVILSWNTLIFIILGALSIFAAIGYTLGKCSYGYYGWGDIFVFLFFGWLAVAGSYFLYSNNIEVWLLLPASAIGLLATAVLNLNNLRDVESDTRHKKRTFIVQIGKEKGFYYHLFLTVFPFIVMMCFNLLVVKKWSAFLFIILLPVFIFHLVRVKKSSGKILNRQFPILIVLTFLFSLCCGVGLLL